MIKCSYIKDGKQFSLILKQVHMGPLKSIFQIARVDAAGTTEKVHYMDRPTHAVVVKPMTDTFRIMVSENKKLLIFDDNQPAPWELMPEVHF